MDRISGLPKAILHDILGRLPDKDAAKASVLSKSWRETWFSFPILSVCCTNFLSLHALSLSPNDPLWLRKLDILVEYVSKRLIRLRDQGLSVKEFKLSLVSPKRDYTRVYPHVDQWIQMASESGVEVLELRLIGCFAKLYNLPLCIAEGKSLTKLGESELTQHS
ncbi:hypothetical protein PIB30_049101 [Stylosanthes scabra]|uniref:F-box domain-containing protein n=1 Tax=Stylosanthes scabra TaxID=79078 RepID=A0ABU6SH21_9FABA|nr:hypothetical protein [Stylosanthes scabra]